MAQNTLCGYQLQKEVAAQVQETVCALLHWEDMDYYTLQLNMGTAYVRWWIPAQHEAAEKVKRHPLFWKWWSNQWAMRDEEFLNREKPEGGLPWHVYTVSELRRAYACIHNPRVLVLQRTPGDIIIKEIFKD